MSRLLSLAAVLALTPAVGRAQLPFYFSDVPGNPAFGYRASGPTLTPPTVVYQPLTGPGYGPVFAPTYYNGPVLGGVQTLPSGYPLFAAGYYPTYGTPGYVPQLPLTVVIEQPVVPAAVEPVSVPVGTTPIPAAARTEARTPATLTLKFPAAAKVWLDGKTVAGEAAAERTLTSPSLRPGEKYTFKVKAEWTADGAAKTYDREVTVGAGERTRVLVLGGN